MKNFDLPIRCLLLAAGLGTRLRPITCHQPKCLVEVGGRPILEWWLEHLETIQCEKTIINTHYHAEQVSQFLNNRKSQLIQIVERYEQQLLGTAGTLLANADFFQGSTGILIHADNATDTDLRDLIQAHRNRPAHCVLTMLTFATETPQSCGIVEIDSGGVVQNFHEKVKNPPGNRANGAVYVFEQELLDILQALEEQPHDFSTEILPQLIGRIYTWHTPDHFIDIGTPESLNKARQIWSTSDPAAS